jgi:hypothetical protein
MGIPHQNQRASTWTLLIHSWTVMAMRLGGVIHTDQGGELACLFAFTDMLLRKHKYVIEPTGANSSSQNGAV